MLAHSEEKTPSSLIMKSFAAGFDSNCSGSSLLLLKASRRFAISDVHIDPSVSSFRCGASAGRSTGPCFSGSLSDGGVKNLLDISCLVSMAEPGLPTIPLSKIVRPLYICQYLSDLSSVFSFTASSGLGSTRYSTNFHPRMLVTLDANPHRMSPPPFCPPATPRLQ